MLCDAINVVEGSEVLESEETDPEVNIGNLMLMIILEVILMIFLRTSGRMFTS